jgi:amino acid adenylation domain-containing protein/non-ribosomal peptide synthase protein (TIGR01720 family)
MTETSMSEQTAQNFRLSVQQRRLWLAPEGVQSHQAHGALLIEGEVGAEALRQAVRRVVGRHEMLRALFKRLPGLKIPFRVGRDDAAFAWREVDGRDGRETGLQDRLAELLEPGLWPAFDFENGPLVQTALLTLAPGRHVLLVRLSTLCGDRQSVDTLLGEVSLALHGPAFERLEEPIQYSNVSEWQDELLDSQDEECRQGKAHWARQDLAPLASFSLPGIRPGLSAGAFTQRPVPVELESGVAAELEELAHRTRTPLGVLLLAAWQVLLGRLSGQHDLVTGVVFAGRKYEELNGCIGPLARMLPVTGHLEGDPRFVDLLAKTAEAQRLADEWQEYASWDPEPEFPAAFEFEASREPWTVEGLSFSALIQAASFQWSVIKLHCAHHEGGLTLTLQFDVGSLPAVEAGLLAWRLPRLLRDLCERPEARIGDLVFLPEAERHRMVAELNDSAVAFASGDGVHVRFRRQAALTPDAPALAFEDQRLTYAELDRLSDRIAYRLRALGVGVEDRVALLCERSAGIVASLLGVLKTGAAYVPLDPALPRPRLAMMVEDAGAVALIYQAGLDPDGLVPPSRRICIDDPEALEAAGENALEPQAPLLDSLAYVLFTSGSTGRPKGVAIGHRQLLSYVDAFRERAQPPAGASFATVSTFAADLGNTMVFPALLTGGCLHVVAAERATDADAFADYMGERAIDCLKIVPSHLAALLAASRPEDVLPRLLLVLGGEAASWRLIERIETLAPHCRILNHYGPTETTVGVTTLEIAPVRPAPSSPVVPLGRPMANSRILLLDERALLTAPGVPGELHIGGAGLARGYLGRPDLTAERFLPSPWGEAGSRLYRTGDLARLLPDGRVEFLGRLDHQVKIHGFRIETREIELMLSRQPGVREALVAVREDIPEEKRLVAYAVLQAGHLGSLETLRTALREELPAYMIPSAIVILPALPLTPNGKVDLGALPAPETVQSAERTSYVAPRNQVEDELARIWSAVLGIPRVGIHDNFFELRGDSILAIKVISVANRAGLVLQPRHLFEHQTIARLAAVVGTTAQVRSDQGPVTGAVALTPIQRWFFEQGFADPEHWNMSALWSVDETLSPTFLDAMTRRLVENHDAFRLRFVRGEEGWQQFSAGIDDVRDPVTVVDLAGLPDGEQTPAIEAAGGALQAALDLGRGPLLRLGLFLLGPGRSNRLLVAVHHLVMDGISWRILLEDLQTSWRQLADGRPIELAPKSTSYRDWAERLTDYARSTADEELAYWSAALPAEATPLPVDHPDGRNSLASERSLLTSLDAGETTSLLERGLAAYRAQINDVLLTALVRGFALWTGRRSLLVELEGHGREPLFEDIDLSRTIGWFTTHFPVWLESGATVGEDLKAVKERLRGIPARGLGYGALRYLSPRGDDVAGRWPEPEIKLNYLGQFDQVLSSAAGFAPAPEPRGLDRSPRSARPCLLAVDGSIVGGCLHLRFSYSAALHHEESVCKLTHHVMESLRELIAHCLSPEAGGYTPSDFPLARLRQEELDPLLAGLPRHGVEDIYAASPLQKSLLMHLLSFPGTTVGFEQKSTILQGDFDPDAFVRTWKRVIDRHPILRTAFAWDGLATPRQVVHRQVEPPVGLHDWRGLSGEEQAERLRAFLEEDRKTGFDPSRPPLMRLALIRLAEDRSCFVWSYSHLLLDAWCRTLVLREVFAFYAAFSEGRDLELPEGRPFRNYIAWLDRQDAAAAAAYWRQTLAGVSQPTPLWIDRLPDRTPDGERSYRSADFQLPETAGSALRAFAQVQRVTLNTALLGAWALLLSRYSRESDVLFGSTVAGRPADLPEVESILGMFINNLPVRVRVDEGAAIGLWLRELQESLAELRSFEWCAPDQVRDWAGIPGGQPLHESLLVVQNYPVDYLAPADAAPAESPRLAIVSYESRLETNYPVTVVAGPLEPISVRLFYDARRIDPVLAARMARHLEMLLTGIAGDADRRISALPLLTAEEREQLAGWSAGGLAAAPGARLDLAFAEWVRRSPDTVALTSGSERVTCRELGDRVDRLAREMSGGARVPLHAEDRAGLAAAPLALLQAGAEASLLAALGGPAGVELSPEGLTADGFRRELGLTPGSRLWISDRRPSAQLAVQLALALAAGFPVVVPPAGDGAEERLRSLAEPEVAAVLASPAELCELLAAGWPVAAGLRVVSSGPPARGLARELSALGGGVHVLYDPAGTGVPVAGCRLEDSEPPSVGFPLPGMTIRLLGPGGQPVPQGVPGELCVGGPYRPAGEVDGRWIFDAPDGSLPLLRTGELARWRSDGRIETLGAMGRVEPLPGARVPTGLVEAALRRHPALRDAVVTSWANQAGDLRLVAYVVPDPALPPSAQELRTFLQPQLPRHMLSALFVVLPALPLGPEGEVDHAALPAPESAGSRLQQSYAAARDPLEVMLLRIWEDLLGIQPIGIRDNFFELGGHSMLAVQILAALPTHQGGKLPLSALLQAPTVERLADALRARNLSQAWSPLVELQTGGPGLPFFCVHPLSGEVFSFRDLAAAMGGSQPFFGLQARIWEDHLEPHGSIEEIAECYLDAIRSVQPSGPYALGGWSFGGLVALEMAQRLHAAGDEVGLLAILDTNLCPTLPASERLDRFKRFEEKHASLSFEDVWELASNDEEMGPEIEMAKRLLRMPEGMDRQMIRRYRRIGEVFAKVRNAHRPQPYPGRVTLFRAVGGYVRFLDDPTLGWGAISPDKLEICDVPGNHNDLIYRPHARALADAIKTRLPRRAARQATAVQPERRGTKP